MLVFFQHKRKVLFLGCPLIIVLLAFSCNSQADRKYFNGQISIVDCKLTDTIQGEKVEIGNNYPGWLNASDSLIFIHSIIKQENFITVYNYVTGEHKGEFFIKGRGPGEFINLSKIYQIYRRDDQLKATLYSPNDEGIVVWDII